MNDEQPHFNLVDEPWIIAKTLGGDVKELSLIELFEQADELEALANETPTQDFAILRVLLAILQRAISPNLEEEDGPVEVWGKLWNGETLPLNDIRHYLAEWHFRFDLFDEEFPFMQVPDLQSKEWDPTKIMFGAEKSDLSPSRTGFRALYLTFSEASRWLITTQAFGFAGTLSPSEGDPEVSQGKTYGNEAGWAGRIGGIFAEGFSLRDTLLFNLVLWGAEPTQLFPDDDIPVWEKAPQSRFIRTDCEPKGCADLYTWQSKRVRLISTNDFVTGVLVTGGDRFSGVNRQAMEPMCVWKRKNSRSIEYVPVALSADKTMWKGLNSLMMIASHSDESDGFLMPGIIKWLNYLLSANQDGAFDGDKVMRLRAIGIQYKNKSAIDTVIDDYIGIHLYLISSEGQKAAHAVHDCISATDSAVQRLGRFAQDLVLASGFRPSNKRTSKNPLTKAKDTTESEAYFEIDQEFRRWVSNISKQTHLVQFEANWAENVRRILEIRAWKLIAEVDPVAIVGHKQKRGNIYKWVSAAGAFDEFNKELRLTLEPLMIDEDGERKVMVQ